MLLSTFQSNVESPAVVKSSNSIWGCCLEVELSRGFCYDDFAETWRAVIRCYYKLIVEV